MIIRLGSDYWVDASDGLNWTLRKGESDNPRKKGKVLGYFSSLRRAVVAAGWEEVMLDDVDIPVRQFEERLNRAADALLARLEASARPDERPVCGQNRTMDREVQLTQ